MEGCPKNKLKTKDDWPFAGCCTRQTYQVSTPDIYWFFSRNGEILRKKLDSEEDLVCLLARPLPSPPLCMVLTCIWLVCLQKHLTSRKTLQTSQPQCWTRAGGTRQSWCGVAWPLTGHSVIDGGLPSWHVVKFGKERLFAEFLVISTQQSNLLSTFFWALSKAAVPGNVLCRSNKASP